MRSKPRPATGWLAAAIAAAALAFAACGGEAQVRQTAPPAAEPQAQPEPQAEPQQQEAAEQDQTEPPPPAQEQEELPQESDDSDAGAQQDEPEEPAAEQDAPQQESAAAAVEDEQDEPAEPDEPVEQIAPGTRIITLFGDLTEVVYALGAQDFLVARDTASIYPPEAEDLPNLGFNQALSPEGVLAFAPTIIFGTPAAGPGETLDHVRNAGVEVVIIDQDDDLDAPAAKVRTVGAALGIPRRAEALALDIERRLAAVQASIGETERGPQVLFLYLRGALFQFAGGDGSPSQILIEAAGGIDAGTAAGIVGFQPLTPEAVVAADPEALLLMEGGVESVGGIDGLLRIPGIAETRAGRARRFIIMDDLYLLNFGPRMPDALADLAAELQRLRDELGDG